MRPIGRRLVVWALLLAFAGGSIVLMIHMPGRSHRGPLAPLRGEEAALRDRLRRHVTVLAGEIGERNQWRPAALHAASAYLEAAFEQIGDRVASEAFPVDGQQVRNLVVNRPGTGRADEIVVVGGHYDSVLGSPGANDNATGAAAVVEVARLLAGRRHARTLRFAAFVNEEPPFFQTEGMGSLLHARRARERGEKVVAMLSLETIGYYADTPGSQAYPFPLGLLYPTRGDFVGFVGDTGSRSLVREAIRSFRAHAAFPSEGAAVPGLLPGVGWSDHWAFWQAGYSAIMVTDTALYRYPAYHSVEDTPEKVDYDRLARVVAGLAPVVAELAGSAATAR